MKWHALADWPAIRWKTKPSTRPAGSRRTVLLLFSLFAVLPCVLSVSAAATGRLDWSIPFFYNLLILAVLIAITTTNGTRWLHSVVLILCSLNLAVFTPEFFLRTINFQYASSVSYRGLRPIHRTLFVPDSDLMWKYREGSPGVNSLGFKDGEVVIPKPKGVKRILFIGDSCTGQGFAKYVELLLNQQLASDSIRYDCVILAVPGYSTHQGRIVAEKYSAILEADMAFVYFGWNDHWLAWGGTDAEQCASVVTPVLRRVVHHSRMLQLALLVSESLGSEDGVIDRVRVPEVEFYDNLRAIDSILSDAGMQVVFVTAPTTHDAFGVPSYLVENRHAPSATFVIKEHREYCEIVRTVATESNVGLLDLERELAHARLHNELFTADGIHFTQAGLRALGEIFFRHISNSNLAK